MDPLGQNEKHNPKLLVESLLQDFDHFENTFLPPFPFDPKNDNEYIDLNYLDEVLATDANIVDNAAVSEAPKTENVMSYGNDGSSGINVCVRYFTTRTNVESQVGNNGKNWVTRRRYGRGPKKETISKEERRMRGRIAARKTFEKKKAQFLQMEAEVQRLREENACIKKLLFRQENEKVDTRGRQLQRTISAPM